MTGKNVVSNDHAGPIEPQSGEKRTRVYLDNCAYNRPYDDQSQIKIELETQAKLKIQRLITDKQIELASSYMSLYECGENPNQDTAALITDYINSHSSVHVSIARKNEIEKIAEEVMENIMPTITKNTSVNKFALYSKGINALREMLGTLDTEEFIALVKSDQFDYTSWQRQHFDQKTREQISQEAETYVTAHPYKGDPSTVI